MAGLVDMITASHIAASIGNIRFDQTILAFDFKPSLGVVAKDIDRLGLDIRSMREPLTRSVREVMVPSIRQNFEVGGRPHWDPLAYATVKMRGSATPVLVRSGNLKRAVTTIKVWTITQTAATIKSLPAKVSYGNVHQAGFGGSGGGKGWFKPYQNKARELLGSEATPREVDALAFKIFDKRQKKHGPAPSRVPEIPARQFVLFQDEDLDDIQDVFGDWLEERARRVGKFR